MVTDLGPVASGFYLKYHGATRLITANLDRSADEKKFNIQIFFKPRAGHKIQWNNALTELKKKKKKEKKGKRSEKRRIKVIRRQRLN